MPLISGVTLLNMAHEECTQLMRVTNTIIDDLGLFISPERAKRGETSTHETAAKKASV